MINRFHSISLIDSENRVARNCGQLIQLWLAELLQWFYFEERSWDRCE
ncbi:MAG: hypothetical protein JWP89_311 [Schlesneria sp.]|nr:hypothetical protein [Schlesneria sp.]